MIKLDLDAPATLELRPDWRKQRLQGPDTIRFDTAAEAIAFAVESEDAYRLTGACLRFGGATLTLPQMKAIYESPDFPPARRRRPTARGAPRAKEAEP